MRIVSLLFWMGVSVAVGLAVFVLILRFAKRFGPLAGVASVVSNATGVAA